ncbi:MAG TPA: (d)CMP kinase [Methylophilaceae bacterium]
MSRKTAHIPVIAIDGPSASGKGTVAQLVAKALKFHYLDSGALYRIVAFAAQKSGISWQDEAALANLAGTLQISFDGGEIYLGDDKISEEVRSEALSKGASEVAVHQDLRRALLDIQLKFRREPGLVADGRDMGSVVFPDAQIKVFLTASSEVRAERRYKQLINKGNNVTLRAVLADIEARDARDMQRASAPLVQVADAMLLDTSQMGINEAVAQVLQWFHRNK